MTDNRVNREFEVIAFSEFCEALGVGDLTDVEQLDITLEESTELVLKRIEHDNFLGISIEPVYPEWSKPAGCQLVQRVRFLGLDNNPRAFLKQLGARVDNHITATAALLARLRLSNDLGTDGFLVAIRFFNNDALMFLTPNEKMN